MFSSKNDGFFVLNYLSSKLLILDNQEARLMRAQNTHERRDEMEGRQRRESRDRKHSCICISFLKHLMIKDFMVVMNINMF